MVDELLEGLNELELGVGNGNGALQVQSTSRDVVLKSVILTLFVLTSLNRLQFLDPN